MPVLGWRGNLLALHRDPIAYVSAMYETYGEIVALTTEHPSLVFAFGPRYNEQLFANATCFARALSPAALHGNPASQAHTAAVQSLIDDAFAASYRATVVEQTTALLDRWGLGQQVDVAYVMRRLTLGIAAQMLFGLDQPADLAAIRQVVQHWQRASLATLVSETAFDPPGTPFHRLRLLTERLAHVVAARIGAHRAANEDVPVAHGSLLARALAAQTAGQLAINEDELIGTIAALFVASFESTASSISWTLFLLSQHLRSLRDVRAEIMPAVRNGALAEHLDRLPLLHRIIKESLRLFPPCSIGLRLCTQPCALGAYQLGAGALVLYSPYVTHRMPEHYFAPRKFRPERWLYLDESPYVFLPFGAQGARTSVGADLALDEIKLVLATLLQRTLLALAPGATVDRSLRVALMPRHGLPMIISPPNRGIVRREAHGTVRDMIDL